MKANWRRWSALYAARARREKWILGFAALAIVYALVDALWLTPATRAWQTERKAAVQKQADLKRMSEQVTLLAAQLRSQAAQTQAEITAGRRDLGTLTEQLASFEKTMVPARRMAEFLHGLLPGRGLEVVALKTLAPVPLINRVAAEPADGKVAESKPTDARNPAAGSAEAASPVSAAANLYKHGVEITLAGSYPALLDYLDRLEKSPQKVMFGRMELRVDKYPRSELTLTLFTLSLDRSWLIV